MQRTSVPRLAIGGFLLVLALPLVLAGSALLWFNAAERDDDGWYRSDTYALRTDTYALTSERLDLHTGVRGRDLTPFDVGTIEVTATNSGGGDVFVGVAREGDVDAYLAGVAHAEVIDVAGDPVDAEYATFPGERRPAPPGEETFWVAAASGPGRQRATWDIDDGEWAVVVMNPAGGAGVAVDVSAGLHTDVLLPIGLALLGVGVLFALGGGLLVASGLGGTGAARAGDDLALRAASDEPVRIWGELDPELSRWLWLVKWLLALPHLVLLALLWPVGVLLTIVAGVSILFTGRYPERIFDLNVGILRWTWRVTFYAFALGTDRYPPFSLGPDPTYPADLVVERPGRLSRSLVLVKSWLLALPHLVVIAVFGGTFVAWPWAGGDDRRPLLAGGLVGVLALVAGVVLLVRRRYPRAIFDFVMGMERWTYRVLVYVALMRDEYPPFRLDLGGGAPLPTAPGSSPVPQQDDAAAA